MDLVRRCLHMACTWKYKRTLNDQLAAVYGKHTTMYHLQLGNISTQ